MFRPPMTPNLRSASGLGAWSRPRTARVSSLSDFSRAIATTDPSARAIASPIADSSAATTAAELVGDALGGSAHASRATAIGKRVGIDGLLNLRAPNDCIAHPKPAVTLGPDQPEAPAS